MNLVQLLQERSRLHPERAALIDRAGGEDRVVSYSELLHRVAVGAARFRELGLERGCTVLVFQPVSIELYECLLAAFHAGIRVMLVDPSSGREFLAKCCSRAKPDAYFGSWKAMALRSVVRPLRQIPLAIRSGCWFPGARSWKAGDMEAELVDLADETPALITFTSGSTGLPKAAVRSHGFLLAQHRALSDALMFKEGEVDLITLPVFVLANLASGITSVLAATNLAKPGSPDAQAVHAQCARHRVTRCAASPAFFEAMLRSGAGLPPLEKLFTGGAPVYNDLLTRLAKALPQAVVHSVYGSTEAEPMAHFSAGELTGEIDALTGAGGGICAGVPIEAISLKVIFDRWGRPLGPLTERELNDLTLPVGVAGEIVVTGEHVLKGYLDGAGDEETKIKVGDDVWHRTGDAGWIDEKGCLWLLGRCSERMTPGIPQEGIPEEALRYPFAIECALRRRFPSIRMAALEWNGTRTLVVGQCCDTETTDAIEELSRRLGIAEVIQLESLPLDKRHNAKIDYPALRKILSDR